MSKIMGLPGQMMDRPLLIPQCLDYAAEIFPHIEVVSQRVEGDLHRTTYADLAVRARRLGAVLQGLGIKPGDRVATLAWNGYRHLELYYAIAGMRAASVMATTWRSVLKAGRSFSTSGANVVS